MCLSALSEELLAAVPEQRRRWDGYVDDSLRRVLKHYCPRFKVFMEEVHSFSVDSLRWDADCCGVCINDGALQFESCRVLRQPTFLYC